MMKKIVLLSLLLLITILSYSQKLKLYDLTCEHQVNPIGIETQQPRLSWKIKTSNRDVLQMAYSIRVSETSSFSENNVWESGKVNSSESNLVSYNGAALESTKRYYWQVKIWDNTNNISAWSSSVYWEMGILDKNEWQAKWIEPIQDTLSNGPALTLRKEFALSKKIKRASAYITGHGLYELYLNEKKLLSVRNQMLD